jgi:hypothetical protein
MAGRLFDRQVSLLEYLTSGTAIFGGKVDSALERSVRGFDRDMLRLEARFSYRKRMEKILAAFPKTFALLGGEQDLIVQEIVQEFVETCPPVDISRLVNARQFHDFLSGRWQRTPPAPPYLPDVAACELACATVRVDVDERGPATVPDEGKPPRKHIRRRPGVILLRCRFDIRPIFETDAADCDPPERDTPLVVAMAPRTPQPQVSELPPVIFDLLAALDDWTDPAELGGTAELKAVIRELAEHGLLEVAR